MYKDLGNKKEADHCLPLGVAANFRELRSVPVRIHKFFHACRHVSFQRAFSRPRTILALVGFFLYTAHPHI